MRNGYYIVQLDLSTINKSSVGVSKKINDQIAYLNSFSDIHCELISLYRKRRKLARLLSYFNKNEFMPFLNQFRDADFFYIRASIPVTSGLIFFLQKIKLKYPNCKILYEIPTFPYDKEVTNIKAKVSLFIDRKFRKKLQLYVDYILTFSADKNIWGIPTMHISNGVDLNRIRVVENNNKLKNEINLIAVAQFNYWHGYDRLINGLREYYNNNTNSDYNINIHLVGNTNLVNYKAIACDEKIMNHVVFHGELFGAQLDEIFNSMDIAVCSLGCHRKGFFGKTSELKSREYLARGLPIITSTGIDILSDNFEYFLKVPEDDSYINIQNIINFFESIKLENEFSLVSKKIRLFAEKKCSMEYGMKSVIDFIK